MLKVAKFGGTSLANADRIRKVREIIDADEARRFIVPKRDVHGQIVTGIAGKKGFSVFSIEKAMMNEEIGFGRRVLEIFERYQVSYEHVPSGIDTLSVIVSGQLLKDCEPLIVSDLELLKPDRIEVLHGIGLIATVGQGMNHSIGTAARLFTALAKHRVNVRMIDQGSSEQNIIVGVDEKDIEAAIAAIHQEFTSGEAASPA